jgi:hypothetical protein
MAVDRATDPHFKDHAKTYSGFLNMLKWAIILLAITLVGLFAFAFGE